MTLPEKPTDGSDLEPIFSQKAVEEVMWATPNFQKAEVLQEFLLCLC